MPSIKNGLSLISRMDKEFVGTVAFKNEKLTLPDGSKVAIGIDGERWVIVYQESSATPFVVYEFNANRMTVVKDKQLGGPEDYEKVSKIVNYFFEQADIDDMVTIEPGGKKT